MSMHCPTDTAPMEFAKSLCTEVGDKANMHAPLFSKSFIVFSYLGIYWFLQNCTSLQQHLYIPTALYFFK